VLRSFDNRIGAFGNFVDVSRVIASAAFVVVSACSVSPDGDGLSPADGAGPAGPNAPDDATSTDDGQWTESGDTAEPTSTETSGADTETTSDDGLLTSGDTATAEATDATSASDTAVTATDAGFTVSTTGDPGPGTTGEEPVCGDGVVDAGESCDGADLGGMDCSQLGFSGGQLACTVACAFDTSGCTQGCLDPGEPCFGPTDCCGSGCGKGGLNCSMGGVDICCP
jgi:hypothetical protein